MKKDIRRLGLFFLLLFLFSFFISCELEDDDETGNPKPGYLDRMPEETNIGANTFGCYVNGKLAASQGFYQTEGLKPYLWPATVRYVNGFWEEYTGWLEDTVYTHMVLGAGIRDASIRIEMDAVPFVGVNECDFYVRFKTTLAESGSINAVINIARFDTIEHVISGYFDDINIPMDLTNSVIHITNGQFDIKYGQNF